MFPDDCVQSIIGADKWWERNGEQGVCRGALIFAFVPHVDQVPYTFEPIGRTDPTRHDDAIVRVSPLKTNLPLKPTDLPVAAMTLHAGEVWAAYRAKKRPCLVFSTGSPLVDRTLTRGTPNSSTAPTLLVAPYYGARKSAQRTGYKPEFVERVRHCEYPQFVWDFLPIPGGEESILRLDHLQPVGAQPTSYMLSNYRLSADAMDIVDELLGWLVWGGVEPDSLIALYRSEIEETFGGGEGSR
jgi:hypothetical protein